jgi:FKBP-type peptidyl-prolyl cis-trans isomerase
MLGLSLLVASASAQDTMKAVPAKTNAATDYSKIFKSDKEKFSYAIGMVTGAGPKGQIKRFELDVDTDAITKGFKESLDGTNTLITETQMREVLGQLNEMIGAKQKEKAEKVKKDGIAFLEKNKTEQGVVTLPSGLQYKVIVAGTGPTPNSTDELSVNYAGTLIDGTEFDNSAKRGKPFSTSLSGGIIQGWKEALKLMAVGSKWKVFIPAELGYGERPTGQIPANSVLIFDMELLSASAPPMPAASAVPANPGTPLTSDIIKVPSAEEIKKGAKIETIKAEDLEKEKAKSSSTNK